PGHGGGEARHGPRPPGPADRPGPAAAGTGGEGDEHGGGPDAGRPQPGRPRPADNVADPVRGEPDRPKLTVVTDLVARARAIADEVLFPAAAEVDRDGVAPPGHFDLLAAEGFYGIAVDDSLGLTETVAILEALAGGCLSTTFIWMQHHGLIRGI